MVLVWSSYQTDIGRVYPMYALSVFQVNDVNSNVNPIDLLPPTIQALLIEVKYPCGVSLLTPRRLSIWASDGGQFEVNYPVPFNEALANFLTANTQIQAWEFIGERIRYGRLRRMLENV